MNNTTTPTNAAREAGQAYTLHVARPSDYYGWDAWVVDDATGAIIGDGWDVDRDKAQRDAMDDASYTAGRLVPTLA